MTYTSEMFRKQRIIVLLPGDTRLPKHAISGEVTNWEMAGRGGREEKWMERLTEDRRAFGAVVSTGNSPEIFGLETSDWTVAARKGADVVRGSGEGARSTHRSSVGSGQHRGQHPPRVRCSQACL